MRLCSLSRLAALLSVLTACAHAVIPGTEVRDTPENRQIMSVIDKLHEGLQSRDGELIISLVSTQYFEDNGTVSQKDDYGYGELRDKIIQQCLKATSEFHVNFTVHEIGVDHDRAHADIRFVSRAHISMPSGAVWDTQRDFDRFELIKEDGKWLFTSGL